jgi:hypothetical protein
VRCRSREEEKEEDYYQSLIMQEKEASVQKRKAQIAILECGCGGVCFL